MRGCRHLARRPAVPPSFSGVPRARPPCSASPASSGGDTRRPRSLCNAVPRREALASVSAGPRPKMVAKTLLGAEILVKAMIIPGGIRSKPLGNAHWSRPRDLSTGAHQKSGGDVGERGDRKALPWIPAHDGREGKGSQKWRSARPSGNSWEESADTYFSRTGGKSVEDNWGKTDRISTGRRNSTEERRLEKEVNEEEDVEPIDDPRWNRIKNRFVSKQALYERPEVAQWNRQEDWGRRTWKQATESSSVPKMVGEGVYGVGPVLAALTVRRREFYSLYVQEGLDLNGNSRKKKDKKGVEKILRIAEEIGLTVKEASKHDLNMVVDNRPHQGLVLDASPLEMVVIRELDPVLMNKGNKVPPVWMALDEVMDPQNLGAILRSAYFFGVEGVVLCAKNSAPLSGVVSKASAGSLEMIELRSCKNMMQFLTSSVENGWRVLGGSVSSKALPLCEVEEGVPTILVLGSEGTGLRPLVERSCTQLVRIPGNTPADVNVGGNEEEGEEMGGKCLTQDFNSFLAVESLNVSVAAGVLLYHLVGNATPKQSENSQKS